MEELLRNLGFTECDDDPGTLELCCNDEEYMPDLLEALGVDDYDVDLVILQVTLPDIAIIYADGEQYDTTVQEIVDAVQSVF